MNENSLALTQAVILWVTVLPDVRDIRNRSDAAFAHDTRTTVYAALALSLGVGVGLAFIARQPGPLITTALTSAALVGATEYLLAQPSTAITETE